MSLINVIIGRFQVDNLHKSHKDFINQVYDFDANQVVFLLGVPAFIGTKRDPIPYDLRAKMIMEAFPSALVLPVIDMESDNDWSDQIDFLLSRAFPGNKIRLFCSRDGFKTHYNGKFTVIELDAQDPTESSSNRREVIKNNPEDSDSFRAGIIYAIENAWEYSRPAVDIAVVHKEALSKTSSSPEYSILLGRKEKESFWRLPGGMVDKTDVSYEMTAKRELMEETGLIVEGVMEYLGSFLVKDWRAERANVSIHSTLFMAHYSHGRETAGDDLKELRWFNLYELDLNDDVMAGHQPLIYRVQTKLSKQG